MLKKYIKKYLRESIKDNPVWYHGTPDVRELEKEGGFTSRSLTVDYISDIDTYFKLQNDLKKYRESGDEEKYFNTLDLVPKLKKKTTIRKPIFLSNDFSVAKTYADPNRAFDYQNSKEKVLKVNVTNGKGVKIVATGDRFRFIDVNKVKRGFINAGIDENEINKIIKQFTYYQKSDKGIKTDVIAILGEWFGFDYIDVVGVLDSYEGGRIKSTVRMVFNPSHVTIIK